ncbi:unnamed protein product [Enterobius vermicularis]|uniref:SERPIN domain-containing protein n=1 Tax=Enterobius vermicularis TaxID=51028 RepID=A0A0N4V2B6_ENTVE|nr:unnamed protein product [Enterobius vermicularis]
MPSKTSAASITWFYKLSAVDPLSEEQLKGLNYIRLIKMMTAIICKFTPISICKTLDKTPAQRFAGLELSRSIFPKIVRCTRKSNFVIANNNKWIEVQTRSKIKNFVLPEMINPETRLMIINAIYFKGEWADDFQKELTRN